MKSFRVSLCLAGTFAFLLFGYQNCANEMYQETAMGDSSLSYQCYNGDSGSCADNLGRSEDQLFLAVGGEPTRAVKRVAGGTLLEFGGDCHTAQYPSNQVVYQLLELVATSGGASQNVFASGVAGTCENNRFNGVVILPTAYNYAKSYRLKFKLMAYDESGESVSGSLGEYTIELVPAQ